MATNSYWRVVDELSGAVFEQEITADPPANTVAYDCDCDEVCLETSFCFLKLEWISSEQPNLVDEF